MTGYWTPFEEHYNPDFSSYWRLIGKKGAHKLNG